MPPKFRSERATLPILAAIIVAHALVLGAVVALAAKDGPAFQVEIFRDYADKIFDGQVPYSDFPYEYPPLSLFILVLPRLFTADPTLYAALFGLEMLLFDIVILLGLSRIGTRPLVLYGVGLLLFWRLPYIRHDLVPVAAATVGALLLLRGRALWAAALWGVGGAIKLYPMVAVPALAAGPWETAKRWLVAGSVFAAGILWGVLAFGPDALQFLTYHSDRPAMIESLPANVLLLLPGAEVINTFGSFNVVGPLGDALVAFFENFQIVATVLALVVVWWQGRSLRAEPRAVAVRGAAVATLAFAIFGKVLSPHFLFWPLPLLAISTTLGGMRFPRATWALYFVVLIITTAINEQYWAIDANLPYFTAMLTVRNLLLLPLFALTLLPPGGASQDEKHRKHPAADGEDVR